MPIPEHTGREAAPSGFVPVVGERDSDREDRARDTEEEAEHQQQRVGAGRSGGPDGQHRQDRRQRHGDEHDAAAEPVGERPDDYPANRPDQDWRRHQHRRLGAAQRQIAGVGGGQRADHVSRPEIDGRDPRGQRQVHTAPRAGVQRRSRVHILRKPFDRDLGSELVGIGD
jgi:hypothetical protein